MKSAMSQALQRPSFRALSPENRLRTLTEEFCAQAAKEGLQILPHREVAWERFRTFSLEDQLKKVDAFEKYFRACASAVDGGLELRDSVGLFKRVTESLGLRVPQNFFDHLHADDVIEIYSRDFTQIFRNLRFLEVCSYSLADLSAFEWSELYRRPMTVTQNLIEWAQSLLGQEEASVTPSSVPDHFLEEVFSPSRYKFFIQQKVGSPVLDANGQIVGLVATLRATPLDGMSSEGFEAPKISLLSP